MKQIYNLLVLSILAGCIQSCSDNVAVFQTGMAKVRIFNAQIKSPDVSVTLDSQMVLTSLTNGMLSNPIDVRSRYARVFEIRNPNDSSANGRIALNTYTLADNQSYTFVVRGTSITDFLRPIIDTAVSPFAGRAAMRVINACEETFISVYVDTLMLTPFVTDAQTITPLYKAQTGTIRVSAINDDTRDTIAKETVQLQDGKCYHIFLYDSRNGTSVQQNMKIQSVQ